jgi:hypothetical protein
MKKRTKFPDLKITSFPKTPNKQTIWTAIDRLREKGSEIYETDVFQHQNNFMFNIDKPWIQTSIHHEIQLMIQEERDKKIDSLL